VRQSRSNWFDWHFLAYNAGLIAGFPAVLAYAAWRITACSKARGGWAERLGILPRIPDGRPRVWVHAVSAGEIAAAVPVCSALLAGMPGAQLIVTTTTPAGKTVALNRLRQAAAIFYFPIDFWPCVARAMRTVRPSLCVLLEKELWPNFLTAARLAGAPVAVVNARISDRTFRRARVLGGFFTRVLRQVGLFAAQSEADARRAIALGLDPSRVAICGNVKFDQSLKPLSAEERTDLRAALGLPPDAPLVVAGSTHPGEEEALLQALRIVKEGIPDARLLLAPRRVERAAQVEQVISQHGFRCLRRTKATGEPTDPDTVIMLDTMGELGRFYGLGEVGFVGGTLVPVGGHDLLQPLAHGLSVVFGNHVHKTRETAQAVLEAGIGFQVSSAEQLAERIGALLADERNRAAIAKAASAFLAKHRGAAERCAEAALSLLNNPIGSRGVPRPSGVNSDAPTP